MKIALAQQNYHIGNFSQNTSKIISSIKEAKALGVDLIVFPELCISGYPPRDFLEYDHFIDECYRSVELIAQHCKGIAAIVGAPVRNPNASGKLLYNAALFLHEGNIEFEYDKALLPDYDVFDEYRYFEPGNKFNVFNYQNKSIGITICEDLWNVGSEQLYTIHPMDEIIKHTPDVIINIAASPFHYEQAEIRKCLLSENAKKYKLPIFYVNQVGSQTELLFDGGSLVIDSSGEIIDEMNYFREELKIFDLDSILKETIKPNHILSPKPIVLIKEALIMGIKDYFSKMGFSKAILGLSGGIDSAVVLALASEALGNENVLSILLPSQFSSEHSVNDAKELCANLGSTWHKVPIEDCYREFENTLSPFFKETSFDVTEENIQARIRAVILMAFSNKFGYITLNTSNKSEAAVGYGTLYGDMCGGLSVIGDVYKTQ
ncbi:MAG: NAD+ synthase, partial [Bacteroidota bacterium]